MAADNDPPKRPRRIRDTAVRGGAGDGVRQRKRDDGYVAAGAAGPDANPADKPVPPERGVEIYPLEEKQPPGSRGPGRIERTWTICVDDWRVPLGMHVETQDVDVDWS